MRRTFYQRNKSTFDKFNGLLLDNTVLGRGLVLAPVIVASYNYQNSIILGLSFILITLTTVILSSFITKKIPYTIRAILYTIIACLVFIPTAMYMNYLFPGSVFKIGVFLPLLVTNSLITVKSESRFHIASKRSMVLDLICHTLGFFIVIVVVGMLREVIGNSSIMGNHIELGFKARAVMLPFSGFIIVGFMAAFVKKISYRLENPRDKKNQGWRSRQTTK